MARKLHWIVLLVGIITSTCEGDRHYRSVRNLNSPGENVICFGDSLTEGVGAGKGKDYPSMLAKHLRYPVINAGRRRDTSADGLSRLEQDVLGQNPRLVIVLFGGNDFLRRLPLDETAKNLEAMVSRIQEAGAMVLLVGLRLGLFTDEYGSIYKKIADEYGTLHLPDILDGILSNPKLKSDSIHPNGAGYRLMAERILKQVKLLLEEADRRRG